MNADPIIHDLEIMSRAVHYNEWILSQFSGYIGQRIIEVGSGIGNHTSVLLDRELIIAVDAYEPCVAYMKRKFTGHDNVIPLHGDISRDEILKLRQYEPDTIICMNVLEHIQDDSVGLAHMHSILKEGGTLALVVPAFQFLSGSIDRVVGHQRRYNKKELKDKLTREGFRIVDLFYMNSIAVFGWFLNNRILGKKQESLQQVLFFDAYVVPWVRFIEKLIRPPFGLSLVAIAKR